MYVHLSAPIWLLSLLHYKNAKVCFCDIILNVGMYVKLYIHITNKNRNNNIFPTGYTQSPQAQGGYIPSQMR